MKEFKPGPNCNLQGECVLYGACVAAQANRQAVEDDKKGRETGNIQSVMKRFDCQHSDNLEALAEAQKYLANKDQTIS